MIFIFAKTWDEAARYAVDNNIPFERGNTQVIHNGNCDPVRGLRLEPQDHVVVLPSTPTDVIEALIDVAYRDRVDLGKRLA